VCYMPNPSHPSFNDPNKIWWSVQVMKLLIMQYSATTHHCYIAKVKSTLWFFISLTEHHAMKTYWGSEGIAQRILELGTRWRWVVSFTPRPLYPQGKSPW
jgi:hypothetical protein